MKALHTANATSTGGRTGHGVTGARGTERLFAVGNPARFVGAVKAAGRKAGVKVPEDSTVTAKVSFLDREDKEGFWISAPEISLLSIDKTTAEHLVRRKGFDVTLEVV